TWEACLTERDEVVLRQATILDVVAAAVLSDHVTPAIADNAGRGRVQHALRRRCEDARPELLQGLARLGVEQPAGVEERLTRGHQVCASQVAVALKVKILKLA